MSGSSVILLIDRSRPIDPITRQVLEIVDRTLHSAEIPYMLVGATARDLLLHHVHGLRITRATYDLDFAILVGSWDHFNEAKRLLLRIPGFIDKQRPPVGRIYYTPPDTTYGTVIDVIPFGKLETAHGTIEWPPDAETVMNVAAFADVLNNAVKVQIEPGSIIPVAPLPGLMILKLFAWLDRRDDRDISDLLRLMETYTDAGNQDRLFEEEEEELGALGFDVTLGGAFMLGKDAYRITEPASRNQLAAALTDDVIKELITHLARKQSPFDDRSEYTSSLVHALLRGFGLRSRE
jgi:predicted nucleotidyltransferase